MRDCIDDFMHKVDQIDLSQLDADSSNGSASNDMFVWRGTGAFTAAGQIRIFEQSGVATIVEGNVNSDLAADFQIQLTDINLGLTASDLFCDLASNAALLHDGMRNSCFAEFPEVAALL